MSNLIIKNSDKLKQISELYSYLSIKLNTERLNEEQVKTIQYKSIFFWQFSLSA